MFFELGTHFELGHRLAVCCVSEREQFLEIGGFLVLTYDTRDFLSLDSLTQKTLIEGGTVELLWRVVQIGHLIQRAKVVLRIAMAIKTPTHGLRLSMLHDFHFINLTVTVLTGDAAIEMSTVVKVHIIRGFVDFYPLDRLASFVGLDHFLQLGTG